MCGVCGGDDIVGTGGVVVAGGGVDVCVVSVGGSGGVDDVGSVRGGDGICWFVYDRVYVGCDVVVVIGGAMMVVCDVGSVGGVVVVADVGGLAVGVVDWIGGVGVVGARVAACGVGGGGRVMDVGRIGGR